MTISTAPSPSPDPDVPQPPRDYGNGDTWADGDAPWAVPVELRPYYAVAEPSPIELEGYLTSGVDVVEERTAERVRVIDAGDDQRPPTTSVESYKADCLVHKHGADFYPTWLHSVRVRAAVRAKKAADRQAAVEAAWLVCDLCGLKSWSVKVEQVPTGGVVHHSRRVSAAVCPDHRATLNYTAGQVLAAQEADRLLIDGRRVGDVAAELIRARLDDAS